MDPIRFSPDLVVVVGSDDPYAGFKSARDALQRQCKHYELISSAVYHPAKDEYNYAKALVSVSSGLEKIKYVAALIFESIKYAWFYMTTSYETPFEKDLATVIDKMKQAASVSDIRDDRRTWEQDIKYRQRNQIGNLVPNLKGGNLLQKLQQSFEHILEHGTAFEKKRAFAAIDAFLSSKDANIGWAVTENARPTLAHILLYGSEDLNAPGMTNAFTRWVVEQDDYFVADVLGEAISEKDILALGFRSRPDRLAAGLEVLPTLLPKYLFEKVENSNAPARGPRQRARQERIIGPLPPVIAEGPDQPALLRTESLRGANLVDYMGHKLRKKNALDKGIRDAWVDSFKKKSPKQRKLKLEANFWKSIVRELGDRYYEKFKTQVVLPVLSEEISHMYPQDLRYKIPNFDQRVQLTEDHLDPSRFAEIFYGTQREPRSHGILEDHRQAVEAVNQRRANAKAKADKSWHPGKEVDCVDKLQEKHKELLLHAKAIAHYRAKKYVEQLRDTRQKSYSFSAKNQTRKSQLAQADEVNFDQFNDAENVDSGRDSDSEKMPLLSGRQGRAPSSRLFDFVRQHERIRDELPSRESPLAVPVDTGAGLFAPGYSRHYMAAQGPLESSQRESPSDPYWEVLDVEDL